MTEASQNGQPPFIINIDGQEYDANTFDNNQKYLVSQLTDIERKIEAQKFQLDQISAAKRLFTQALIESLNEPKLEAPLEDKATN